MLVNEDIETSLKQNQGLAEIFVKPLDSDLTEKVLSIKYIDKIYLTRITTELSKINIVKESTPIFRYVVEDTEEDEEVKGNTRIKINPEFHDDDNSNIIQDGKNYIAKVDGLFVIELGHPKIIPINYDGSAEVKVSDNSMYVLLDIYPSVGDNPIPTLEDIETKIRKLGVTVEIDKDLISQKLLIVESDKIKILNLCVVEGKFPKNGIDGKLENCTDKKEKLKHLEFDEFHRVNPVISVKEDDLIAIVHPPTDGVNGHDIFGKIIKAEPGKPCKIKIGTNTTYEDENKSKIIAKTDGFLNISETEISITDTFTVRGDIDFSSGNIFGKGSLTVKGNVNNEFSLSLSKNIEIGGYVGDAKLDAGENIIIRGGFLGKGNGVIRANGNVEVKFVENQTIFSRASLILNKDALNAKLFVRDEITSKGNRTSIIGGQTIAGDKIQVHTLGNDTGTETIVEVGFDYKKRNSIIKNHERKKYLVTRLEEVDKIILEFAQMKRLSLQNKDKLKLLANEHKEIANEIESIKELNNKITNEIYVPTTSKISVSGTIFPGVKIGINGRFLNINNPISSKTFTLSEDNEVIAIPFVR